MSETQTFEHCYGVLKKYQSFIRDGIHILGGNPALEKIIDYCVS
jgi:hypothetical protein